MTNRIYDVMQNPQKLSTLPKDLKLAFSYLIFVSFGTPPHYLGLYKVHQKVCKFATK